MHIEKENKESNIKVPAEERAVSVAGTGYSLTERAAWILFAKTIAFGLSFALPLLLVRRLSQHEFGLYKQVFLVVGTAITILPLGFGMSAYYFLPRERERQPQIVLNILLFYMVVASFACLALFFSPRFLATIFNSSELVEYGPLIGAVILLWVVSSFLDIVAVANQEPKLASLFIVISQATKSILLLGAAIMFGTVRALVYAAILQGAAQLLILLLYLRSRFACFWRSFDISVLRIQLSYALPLGAAALLFSMQMDLHNYLVSNRFGPSAYAIYAIGCFQLPFVGIIMEAVSSVMIPRVSYLQKQNQNREIVLLTARVMRKLSLIYFPLYAFLMVSGREFITILFTEQYIDSWPIFAINLTLLLPSILILDPIQRAYAEQRYFMLNLHILLVVVLAIALWLGTNHFGLAGTAFVVVVVNLAGRLITAIRLGRVVGVSRRDVKLLEGVGRTAVAAIIAAVATALLRSLLLSLLPGATHFTVLAVCGIAFSLVYIIALLALNILSPQEIETLKRRIPYALRGKGLAVAAAPPPQRHYLSRKLSTARRVLRTRGLGGIIQVLFEKAGVWWRQGEVWEVGKLVGIHSSIVRLDGCKFSTDNAAISEAVKNVLLLGRYEEPERLALKHFLNPELPVVEFGGCMGIVSCLTNRRLRSPSNHVVVEANPDLLPLIEQNRKRNGCCFTVLHGAVAYGSHEVAFHISEHVIASSAQRVTDKSINVPTITLRKITDTFGFNCCTLICDIEGGEAEMVKAEAETLRSRVATLIIEVHDDVMGAEPTAGMISCLKEMGFDVVYKNLDTYVFQNRLIGPARAKHYRWVKGTQYDWGTA